MQKVIKYKDFKLDICMYMSIIQEVLPSRNKIISSSIEFLSKEIFLCRIIKVTVA